ncbi:peptide deformylase [bacterium]|nr:peptide deformylase [bacterium]
MILKIVGFGHPSLRRKNKEITPDFPELDILIENMFETMYNASGVGLAAPQVDIGYRIFIVDGEPMGDLLEDGQSMEGFKKTFINPEKIEEIGKKWAFEEGCLSIPDLREDVRRPDTITLKYLDENLKEHTETFTGMKARIVQHEYDHLEGVLFTDLISGLRKQVVKKRLTKISKGDTNAAYPMKFKH